MNNYEKDIKNRSATEQKLGWGERLGYGTGNIGVGIIRTIIGTYFLVYMTNTALLNVAIISVIIAVSRVFDGISDLIIGNIIDNTESKMGKARVWLARMCLPLFVSVLLMFWVPPQFPEAVKYIYVFLIYNIVNTVLFTFVMLSQYSLLSLITSDKEEHGLLGIISSILLQVGSLACGTLFVKVLSAFADSTGNQNTQKGFTAACIIFCSISVLAIFTSVFTTKERVRGDVRSEKRPKASVAGFMTAFKIMLSERSWIVVTVTTTLCVLVTEMMTQSGVYYSMYVLHDMDNISWIIATILVPSVIIQFAMPSLFKKISKKTFYVGGNLLVSAATLGFALVSPSVPGMVGFSILKGVGTGMLTGILPGLIADLVGETSRKRGRFMPGAGFAVFSTSNKLGSGLGGVIFGFILSAAGFNGALDAQNIAQPAAVPVAVTWTFLWLPMIFTAVSAVIFYLFFDTDKNTGGEESGQSDIK